MRRPGQKKSDRRLPRWTWAAIVAGGIRVGIGTSRAGASPSSRCGGVDRGARFCWSGPGHGCRGSGIASPVLWLRISMLRSRVAERALTAREARRATAHGRVGGVALGGARQVFLRSADGLAGGRVGNVRDVAALGLVVGRTTCETENRNQTDRPEDEGRAHYGGCSCRVRANVSASISARKQVAKEMFGCARTVRTTVRGCSRTNLPAAREVPKFLQRFQGRFGPLETCTQTQNDKDRLGGSSSLRRALKEL